MKKFIRAGLIGAAALAATGSILAVADYTMTQGTGTTFGSIVVGGKHYVQMMLCDLTTPGQCAAVSSGGVVSVGGSVSLTGATNNINNVSGTVSLPTGAATAAKQPALGTAGSASADVLTVQGIASMTPLLVTPAANSAVNVAQVNGVTVLTGAGATGTGSQRTTVAQDTTTVAGTTPANIGVVAQGSTTSGQVGVMNQGAVTTAAPSYTTAQTSPLSLTTTGGLRTDTSTINGVTALTGTGATGTGAQRVTVATDQATNAGAALVKGGVGVVNGGSTYQAVAASQTATVLQTSTGAIGDYLSHCVIYPTSTSPGVVTVFDNTNTAAASAILFPGGSSSLSNLAPIPIPVGAVSTAGAWKVTTGASVSVVCYGKFS